MYLLRPAAEADGKPRVQLFGSGAILREVPAGADILAEKFGVASDVWSVTSYKELRREALEVDRCGGTSSTPTRIPAIPG